MNVCGLKIDFPEIEGVSERQIEYANNLREVYVSRHEERFSQISDMVEQESDYRIKEGFKNGATSTFFEDFNNCERCCLFGINAGGIIATLRDALELEREE